VPKLSGGNYGDSRVVNLTGQVKLGQWLFNWPDLVPGVAITSVSSSPNPKAVEIPNPYTVVALTADTRSTGR